MRSFGFGKRAWIVVALGLVAVPLYLAALAYGCTALATLSDSPGAAPAGSTVTISGTGFGSHNPTTNNGPVQVRLGSLTGPVLASSATTASNFSVQITVPPGTPAGPTFVTATENDSSGQPVFGTPARHDFTVTPSPASGGGAPTPAVSTQQATSSAVAATVTAATASKTTGTSSRSSSKKSKRAKAVAACKKKFNPSKAKGKKAKKAMSSKRSACVKKAKKS